MTFEDKLTQALADAEKAGEIINILDEDSNMGCCVPEIKKVAPQEDANVKRKITVKKERQPVSKRVKIDAS